MISGHLLTFSVDWATPVLIVCLAAIFLIAIQNLIPDHLQKWGFTLQSKEIEVDEDLPPFFSTVKLSSADEILKDEAHINMHYGVAF